MADSSLTETYYAIKNGDRLECGSNSATHGLYNKRGSAEGYKTRILKEATKLLAHYKGILDNIDKYPNTNAETYEKCILQTEERIASIKSYQIVPVRIVEVTE